MLNRNGNPLDTAHLGDTLLNLGDVWQAQRTVMTEETAKQEPTSMAATQALANHLVAENIVYEVAERNERGE